MQPAYPPGAPLSSKSMAEALSRESASERIAEVREGLTLLADYL
jgi:hypothetical protein